MMRFVFALTVMTAALLTGTAAAQTPVTLPPGVGTPAPTPTPATPTPATPTPATPTPATVTPTAVTTSSTVTVTGKITLEGAPAKLYKLYSIHKMEKLVEHTDFSAGFVIPGSRINTDAWMDFAAKMKFKEPIKADEIVMLGIYTSDGKNFDSAMILVEQAGGKRKTYGMNLSGLKIATFDDEVVSFFQRCHHLFGTATTGDFGTGTATDKKK